MAPAPAWLGAATRPQLVLAPRALLELTTTTSPPDPWSRRRVLVALERACERIVAALPGSRNDTRCKQCFLIGGYVARGDVDYPTAFDALLAAACAVAHDPPWPLESLRKWVAQSIAAGMEQPLPLSETEQWLRDFRARRAAWRAS
jgi:hypothetical protein